MKSLTKLLPTLIISILLFGCHKRPANLAELMENYAQQGQNNKISSPFSGAVLVAKNGAVVFENAYGYLNREGEQPNTIHTRFPIASVTKQFTAMLVLQFVEEGKIHLADRVDKHLTYLDSSETGSLTIHQLLSHSSGLPHYEGFEELGLDEATFSSSSYTPRELVMLVDKTKLLFKPGEDASYSSLGYMLLGTILEKISGQTYAELIQKRIAEPLGLKNTGYADNEFARDSLAKGYTYLEAEGIDWLYKKYGGYIEPAPFRDQSSKYSTGGMHSTVRELFVWSEAIRHNRLLSETYSRLLYKANLGGFAYGWIRNWDDLIERNTHVQMINHGGALRGYRSSITLFDDGTTIIFQCNISPIKHQELVHQLYLMTHGIETPEGLSGYPEWNSAAEFERNGGLKALDAYFTELSRLCGYEVLPSDRSMMGILFVYLDAGMYQKAETVMQRLLGRKSISPQFVNSMGYYLLREGYVEEAMICFKRNAEERSHAANSWDSLGDGYKASGDMTRAVESYKKAVRIAELNNDPAVGLYRKNLLSVQPIRR